MGLQDKIAKEIGKQMEEKFALTQERLFAHHSSLIQEKLEGWEEMVREHINKLIDKELDQRILATITQQLEFYSLIGRKK